MLKDIKKIVKRLENDMQEVFAGDMFGEYVAMELVSSIKQLTNAVDIEMFKAIKDCFHDTLGTNNLTEYLNKIENDYEKHGTSIVGQYDFGGNDEGENLFYSIIDILKNGGLYNVKK
jgi:methylaspartate ammonia-lyase